MEYRQFFSVWGWHSLASLYFMHLDGFALQPHKFFLKIFANRTCYTIMRQRLNKMVAQRRRCLRFMSSLEALAFKDDLCSKPSSWHTLPANFNPKLKAPLVKIPANPTLCQIRLYQVTARCTVLRSLIEASLCPFLQWNIDRRTHAVRLLVERFKVRLY